MTDQTEDRDLMAIVNSMIKIVNFEPKAPAQFKRDLKKLCEYVVDAENKKLDDDIPF